MDSSSSHTCGAFFMGVKSMKICTRCHQPKEITEFYPDRSDHRSKCGRKSVCKSCQKIQRAEYLQSEGGRAAVRRWAKTKIAKDIGKRYRLRHPERRKAKDAVYQAIQKGELARPDTKQCPCGDHKAEHYHHYKGYDKKHRLDVMAVCRKYHKELHNPIHDTEEQAK